jgi:hypothetical protein
VDLRARCACVCRGWRATLSERSLWTRLDVSHTSGVSIAVTDELLRGAAARAGGGLQVLDVSRCAAVSQATLLAVVTANAGALHEVRVCHGACVSINLGFNLRAANLLSVGYTETLLRSAPQLRVLDAGVSCGSVADARRALCAEGLLAPLRIHGLRVGAAGAVAEADFLELASDIVSHAWLQQLCLVRALPTPAALEAMVDAALTRRLAALQFACCRLTAASAPALARLLSGRGITELLVWGGGAALLDAHAAALLADALRANATLTSLQLAEVQLWNDMAAANTLLGALTAHPSLRTLSLFDNGVQEADCPAVGTALGALLAANSPALTELDVEMCWLRDAGMAPLFEALPANTHLRTLNCLGNGITDALARVVLLPAVRANASLRVLRMGRTWPGAREAEDVVNVRAAARY